MSARAPHAVRLIVIGDGRMGRAVAQVAAERGCTVVGVLGPVDMPARMTSGVADVAVEFTQPAAAEANVRACLAARVPVVSGTTGWDAGLDAVRAAARASGGTVLHAPNFSLGVHVFQRVVAYAAGLAARASLSAHLVETHHAAKLDAPSGTAKALQRAAAAATGSEIPVTSIRVGHVPGTHELVLDGQFEQLRLTHEARDRRVFADGAVTAALWLAGRTGVFTLDDMLGDTPAG